MEFNVDNAFKIVTGKLEDWFKYFISMLPNFVVAILIIIAFYLIARLIKNLTHRMLHRVTENEAINNLFSTIVYIAILAGGVLIALDVLQLAGVVTSLLAGVGVIGLALAFAFQDIAANFVSGILITFRKPFHIGDIVETQGHMGRVTEIDLRTTTVTTFQGQEILIPNKDIFQNPISNYTRTKERRVDLGVGVSYGDDLRKAKDITINAVKGITGLDEEKDVTLFYNEFGDSSINFTVRFYPKTASQMDYLTAKSDAIMAIKLAFDENELTIPFPIRTLDFGIKGGATLSEMKLPILQANGKN